MSPQTRRTATDCLARCLGLDRGEGKETRRGEKVGRSWQGFKICIYYFCHFFFCFTKCISLLGQFSCILVFYFMNSCRTLPILQLCNTYPMVHTNLTIRSIRASIDNPQEHIFRSVLLTGLFLRVPAGEGVVSALAIKVEHGLSPKCFQSTESVWQSESVGQMPARSNGESFLDFRSTDGRQKSWNAPVIATTFAPLHSSLLYLTTIPTDQNTVKRWQTMRVERVKIIEFSAQGFSYQNIAQKVAVSKATGFRVF